MSSFYDLASLIMIPSGKKAGKVYSQKPLSTDGQLDFTRASTATRIGSDGNIEKTRTNLLLQSNTFNTTWAASNVTLTSGQSGYDGNNGAYKLVSNTSNVSHRIFQSQSQSGVLTFSVYAKPLGYNFIFIYINGKSAFFDLSGGSVGTTSGLINSNILSAGNGFYRCSITFSGITTSNVELYVANTSSTYVYAGDGTSGILIQDAQLEPGLVATNVITTTTAAVSVGSVDNMPRLNYTPGSATSCPSLLLEPQRTNVLLNSEYFNGSPYTANNATLTANIAISPQGVQNAYNFVPTTNSSVGHRIFATSTSLQSATHSIFIKPNGHNYYALRESPSTGACIGFDFTDNSIIVQNSSGGCSASNGKIESYGNGWYRISGTFSFASASSQGFSLYAAAPNWTSGDVESVAWAGDGTSGAYIYGAQVEAGSYPTSYIPTFGATVTRVADTSEKTGISGLIGQTEGVLYFKVSAFEDDNSEKKISLSDGSNNNRVGVQFMDNGTQLLYFLVSGGSDQVIHFQTIGDLKDFKIAFAYKANDVKVYLNGSLIVTETNALMPVSLTKFSFNSAVGTRNFFGNVKQTLLFKTRLTDTQLAELTSLDS